jgi:CRISPR-associated protein (TIGR03986 family)
MIKAPFNFAPLSDHVYSPDWADQISQDIPFSDGISGTIELKITAESPIFVRNGHVLNSDEERFSQTEDGKYFIPGTTLKGTVRSVMEILSFGKMAQVQNASFGLRDLSNGTDGRFYRDKIKPEKVHCGWLYKKDDKYYLDDCDLPWRISAEELDNKYGRDLENFMKNGDFKNDDNRTAKAKYNLFTGCDLTTEFEPDNDLRQNLKVGGRLFVKIVDGGVPGTIVFTGQSGNRKQGKRNRDGERKWEGKYYEFVIPDKIAKEGIEVDQYTIKEFLSIHKNSSDFAEFRKKELDQGEEIPVFFRYDDSDGTIDSIGLSYMYKYPAFNSVYNGIPETLLSDEEHDLAECIFGYIGNKQSVKGRVQFSPAFAIGNIVELGRRSMALSSPHPSYYPLYLGNGQTWNSSSIRIAGHKRYPVRSDILTNAATDAMTTYVRPLDVKTMFVGYITFHNLRKIELGALLSAITFHGHTECYHNLGQGKPLGYGKIKIDANLEKLSKDCNVPELMTSFEKEMIKEEPNWLTSSTLQELFAMAKGIPNDKSASFKYMTMSTNRDDNEFLIGRDEYSKGKQLGLFTQIISGNVPISSYIGNVMSDIKRVNLEKVLKQKQEMEERYRILLNEAEENLDNGDILAAKDKFSEISARFFSKIEEIAPYLKKIDEIILKKKLEFESLKSEAENSYSERDYSSALQRYQEADDFGKTYEFENLSSYIDQCKKMIFNANSDIGSFLSQFRVASIAAFAGRLKKRSLIAENDIVTISNKLKTEIPLLKKADQRKWYDFKNWKPIIDVIGEDLAKKVFDILEK